METTDPVAFHFEGLTLDPSVRALFNGRGREIVLRRSEFDLLLAFVNRPGRPLSRDQLLDAVAGRRSEPYDRTIDVLVGRLRRKIEQNSKQPRLIITIPGVGYKFGVKPRAVAMGSGEERVKLTPATTLPDLPLAPERRQMTIVQCALSGPEFLSAQRDPEDLHHLLSMLRARFVEAIPPESDTTIRLLNDGIRIYFGYPDAHEHQAERAVRAGLSLLELTPNLDTKYSLRARIGVATGLAVTGGPPGPPSGEPVALGDAASLAARLVANARPDTMLISPETRRLVVGLFQLRECEQKIAQDSAPPISTWEVVAEGREKGRFEALHGENIADLVGREEELQLLLRRWDQACAGDGRAVLIGGEPGIGKSRLLRALEDRLGERSRSRLRYFCSPHHQDSALYPVIAQLEIAAGFVRDDSPEAKLSKLEALLRQSKAADEVVALIAGLLCIPTNGCYGLAEISPQQRREKTLAALLTLSGLVANEPTLVIYEDVHWIDPTTLELLRRFVEQVNAAPILVLLTARPDFTPPWPGYAHTTTILLGRLNECEGSALISQIAGGRRLPCGVLRELVGRADGVPLFIEELTKFVMESGLLRDAADDRALDEPLPPLEIPMTLRDSLIARLDRFPAVREVAQVGAAIGREFSHQLLQTVVAMSDLLFGECLDRLIRSGLVFGRGSPPEATYVFKHYLVREAIYETLLRKRRQDIHGRIVKAFEEYSSDIAQQQPEILADQCERAHLTTKAVKYWVAAGQKSIACSSFIEAVRQSHKGLALLSDIPEGRERWQWELELQKILSVALFASRGFGAPDTGLALCRARDLCDRLGEPSNMVSLLYGQTLHYLVRGELPEARRSADNLLSFSRERGYVTGQMVGNQAMGSCLHWFGQFELARQHSERVLALYKSHMHEAWSLIGYDPPGAALWYLSWDYFLLGRLDQAHWASRESLSWSKTQRHAHSSARALVFAAIFCILRRTQTGVHDLAEEAVALATKQRFPFWLGAANVTLGWALMESGKTTEGISLARKGLAEYQATGASLNQTHLLTILAQSLERAGEVDEALMLLRDALAISRATHERWFVAELHRLTGEWLNAYGRAGQTEVEACFCRALAIAREQNAKIWELRAASGLSRLWRNQGKYREACELLEPIYNWFTEGLNTPDLRGARSLLAELRILA